MHIQAKKIVKILNDNGYVAYYAGGWVRDYLLGHDSDDIDIATNAPFQKIKSLFSHTVPIGEAFGIILVVFEKHTYEIATFRKDLEYKDGRRPSSVEFTTAIEDAKRRDFTINGMFFDPIKEEIIDYVDGQKDLKNKIIKAIGDPHKRIAEDRLRMLRAIRLSAKLDFEIEENTKKAIIFHSNELKDCVAMERIYQELDKMSKYKNFKKGLLDAFSLNLLQNIFPSLKALDKKQIEKRLFHLNFLPKNAPTIIKILELFPDYSLDEKISLCKYLKLSNKDIDFITLYDQFLSLEKDPSKKDSLWVHFYKNKNANLIIDIYAAHFKDRDLIKNKHEKRQEILKNFIKRKKPIITSFHLKKEGIPPGEKMGFLLKEAEKISIDEKIEDEKTLMQILKKKYFK